MDDTVITQSVTELETDGNRVLRFRPKTKLAPKIEVYFRTEMKQKRN